MFSTAISMDEQSKLSWYVFEGIRTK